MTPHYFFFFTTLIMVSPLFNVGDLVLIDEKDKAFIVEVDI